MPGRWKKWWWTVNHCGALMSVCNFSTEESWKWKTLKYSKIHKKFNGNSTSTVKQPDSLLCGLGARVSAFREGADGSRNMQNIFMSKPWCQPNRTFVFMVMMHLRFVTHCLTCSFQLSKSQARLWPLAVPKSQPVSGGFYVDLAKEIPQLFTDFLWTCRKTWYADHSTQWVRHFLMDFFGSGLKTSWPKGDWKTNSFYTAMLFGSQKTNRRCDCVARVLYCCIDGWWDSNRIQQVEDS